MHSEFMNWGHGHGIWLGSGIFMIVFGVLVLLAIAALIKFLFEKNKEQPLLDNLNKRYAAGKITKEEFLEAFEKLEQDSDRRETALDILKKRYATGEITKETFEEMKKEIVS
jgi:uncharacterized membrane protein